MAGEPFTYRVTDGWLRDLASEPTPHEPWPCIHWDDRLLEDQIRFLDVQAELGMTCNLAWGLFVDRAWPVPLERAIDDRRAQRLRAFVDAAHARSLKVLAGVGIYSWGFEEIIRQHPEVAASGSGSAGRQVMCPFREAAWDWQRRVLDFLMEPRWGLDGISMQSADQGRCDCEQCVKLSPAEHHARILIRSAEHVRSGRPEWIIGQASWGLRVDEPGELPHLRAISEAVDYMVEVRERSAETGKRREIADHLACAFGSVGGVFVEPPQHWERTRWFLPCGLASARALARLHADGGRACEYFYRPFANPGEEVSWRTGARIMASPETPPETALGDAVEAVYGVTGEDRATLAAWFTRAEDAYFSRARFTAGHGSLSLEPLIWAENPAAPGPPIYLRDRMDAAARAGYAREMEGLKRELAMMAIPNDLARTRTLQGIEGSLADLAVIERDTGG
jgi:hypothetical protein